MLQTSTLKFLIDLRKNNNRDWFAKQRHRYDDAAADFQQFIAQVLKEISKSDPQFKDVDAKQSIFRIYRDVRFSKNKDPYKHNLSAIIKAGGKKSGNCGMYIHIQPGKKNESYIAGGCWQPEAAQLKMIRQEIEYNTSEFKKIIFNKSFKKIFGEMEEEKLKKAPKGVDPDHPDIELLKYTSFVVVHPVDDKELLTKNLVSTSVKAYKTMKPFLDFLNRASH